MLHLSRKPKWISCTIVTMSLPVIDNISRDANFNNLPEKYIVWALSQPFFKERGSIKSENHQFEVKCFIRFWHLVINGVKTHRKLPLLQCYHIFPSTRGVYLPKNHYENYSPQMVPMTPNLGSWLTDYYTLKVVIITFFAKRALSANLEDKQTNKKQINQ